MHNVKPWILPLLTAVLAFGAVGMRLAAVLGPDVTIYDLRTVGNHTDGTNDTGPTTCPPGYGDGLCHGYSVGTDSCNVGSVPLDWCDDVNISNIGCRTSTLPPSSTYHTLQATTSDHPVIAQNLYRLRGGRFEQIGMSFLKHGFYATNVTRAACTGDDGTGQPQPCTTPPWGGTQLGVGCTDFYSASLNGGRPMGRRSDVQGAGAAHPVNPVGGETNDLYDQRIVVRESDLDPAQNDGALYWVEGHYIARDDARAGHGLNNQSYRRALVSPGTFALSLTDATVREQSALFAWPDQDPWVEVVAVDKEMFFLGEAADIPEGGTSHPDYTVTERFLAARRIAKLGTAMTPYHVEYAVQNINSDTAANHFAVDLGGPTSITNAGFTDIDHHSGEPYSTDDWTVLIDEANGTITWQTDEFAADPNANALRWGTTFTFWFDADTFPVAERLGTFQDDGEVVVPFAAFDVGVVFGDGFESGDVGLWSGP